MDYILVELKKTKFFAYLFDGKEESAKEFCRNVSRETMSFSTVGIFRHTPKINSSIPSTLFPITVNVDIHSCLKTKLWH